MVRWWPPSRVAPVTQSVTTIWLGGAVPVTQKRDNHSVKGALPPAAQGLIAGGRGGAAPVAAELRLPRGIFEPKKIGDVLGSERGPGGAGACGWRETVWSAQSKGRPVAGAPCFRNSGV